MVAMKIQILERTDRELRFVLSDTNPQFANMLRRACVGEVSILAVENVDFIENDSALYDEVIAHRLGMMPLQFDTKVFKSRNDCDCEGKGCTNCQIVLVLDKKGPSVVTAKDIKSADPTTAKPLFDDTIIVELFEGQKLKVDMTASLGTGRDHAKYQAARCWYRYYPIVEQHNKVTNGYEVEKICAHGAVRVKDGKLEVGNDCDLSCKIAQTAEPKGAIEIKGDDSKFIFFVESISGLKSEEIVLAAVDVLKSKTKEFEKQVSAL